MQKHAQIRMAGGLNLLFEKKTDGQGICLLFGKKSTYTDDFFLCTTWSLQSQGRLFRLEVVPTLHGSLEGELWCHHVAAGFQNPTLLNYLDIQDQDIMIFDDLSKQINMLWNTMLG